MNDYFSARHECPACKSRHRAELYRIPYSITPMRDHLISFYSPQGGIEFEYLDNQDYALVECMNCGLLYQCEIPNDFLMQKLYEEWLDPHTCFELYEKPREIEYFSSLSSEIVNIAGMFDRPPMDLSFLDFSMGWGHWCRIAQSFGCRVHGTEFSPTRIDYARSKGVTVIDYAEIGNHQYDFINIEQVFEHLPNVRATLMYLKTSLKPNGILKISVPNGWDIKQRLKAGEWNAPKGSPNSLNPVAPLEHINCFNNSSLLSLARSFELVPIDTHKEKTAPPQPQGLKQTVKALPRPYWHKQKKIKKPPSIGKTYMFFRVSDIK